MNITLDHEKFSAVEELSKIHTAIVEGRAALETLKGSTEEYLTGREKEAVERIAKILDESRTALDEVAANHEALTKYGVELRGYANLLSALSKDLTAFALLLRERMASADAALSAKLAEINEAKRDLKAVHADIIEDRKQLAREQMGINEERRLLKDQREAFERAWGELIAKQSAT
jgi:small-conductance mechanosensitive channel